MTPKPLWGTATSAHQVEGNNQWSDWWAWEQSGKVKEPSGAACDQYRLFRDDFRLARSLGHTSHRFSLEWSRLEPCEGQWDESAFRHYDGVFDSLAEQNLEPVVTLHHFTNPFWFAKKGGWLARDAVEKFSQYTRRVAERYGKRAKFWITINEPLIYIYQAYIRGIWPPGEHEAYDHAFAVTRSLLRAHTEAYRILHENSGPEGMWVSMAHHLSQFSPCRSQSILDRLNVFLRRHFLNLLPFQALISGRLFYPGIFSEKLSARSTLDFLGVNYYTRDFIRFGGIWGTGQFGTICEKDHHRQGIQELNDLGWEVHPEGIYEVLSSLKRFNLPVLVTENGICTNDDAQRERFIRSHLEQIRRAKREGTSVFGYFYWSLVDNFEWADGFGPRFGIVELDYASQTRKVRPSAQVLRKECEELFREESHARGTL